MRSRLTLTPMLLVLASCASPPKPPAVDESTRRPANSVMAVDLQACRNDLQNSRILATESGRLADRSAAMLAREAALRQVAAAKQAAPSMTASVNSVFSIRFEFGSTRVVVPAEMAPALVESARFAPLVVLRGRTDGSTDSPAENRIARERAAAVRDYLVGAGVDPARIRVTYQPTGDHVADNSNPAGRMMNRRVEVEVYRVLPVAMGAAMPVHSRPASGLDPEG